MSVPFEVFSQLEIRIGRIVEVDEMPNARKPMYKLRVDFGPMGVRQCVAGIKQYYSKEQLSGKLAAAVVNLQPRSIAGVSSECMLLAAFTETELGLLVPDRDLAPGTPVA